MAGKGKTLGSIIEKNSKAGVQFPVGRIDRFLKDGKYAKRVGLGAPVFLAAVLEYLAIEVLGLAENKARNNKKTRIIPRHIQLAEPEFITSPSNLLSSSSFLTTN
ncbi:uncharacterized protein LOC129891870 [Solanum dulcamara]|uniref:uncharacterized protein LOC129891870 n=1 Tax=Solanum dulcamara TaxID=45834 RepID=UPI002485DF5A|nr:uncharacterized protein LOC129891870 [Solanum dulcamara]